MVCVNCERFGVFDQDIKNGDEVVVELIGIFVKSKTFLDMHTTKAIDFNGTIRHLDCYRKREENKCTH